MANCTRFRKFKPATVAATRTLWVGWAGCTDEQKIARMTLWLAQVANIYAIPVPTLEVSPDAGHNGRYDRLANTIILTKLSFTTLLHEFRHAMQNNTAGACIPAGATANWEDDATAWSLSLYYKIAPVTYRKLATAGEIWNAEIPRLRALRHLPRNGSDVESEAAEEAVIPGLNEVEAAADAAEDRAHGITPNAGAI